MTDKALTPEERHQFWVKEVNSLCFKIDTLKYDLEQARERLRAAVKTRDELKAELKEK